MPELPEVETVKRILEKELIGRKINSLDVLYNLLDTEVNEFKNSLKGKRFLSLSRNGKFLVFHLEDNLVIVSHLRMEGKFFVLDEETPLNKHDHIIFHLDNGKDLRYNDVRKFGRMGLYKEANYMKASPISKLGKEPFDLSPNELFASLQKKKGPIKEVLLDQSIIAGLGNIYDDEVLFATKINPFKEASSLTKKECESIIKESIRILNLAIDNGGSTIKSYHPGKGINGRMQTSLLAYGRGGKPCSACGFPLRKTSLGGRGTVYCPRCQKGERGYVVILTGPLHSGKSLASSFFTKKGYKSFDADKAVKELYDDKTVIKKVATVLGEEILIDDKLDKKAISRIIASDNKKKKALNALIHPLVKAKAEEFILKNKGNIILEIPLLAGSGLEKAGDFVIYMDASESLRAERLKKENRDVTLLKINADYPTLRNKKLSNVIISNDGDITSLEKKLGELILFKD